MPVRVGLIPTPFENDAGVGVAGGRDEPEGGGAGVARHPDVHRSELRAPHRGLEAVHDHVRAHRHHHPLRVVAGLRWLAHGRCPVGVQPCQQDARLDLRARLGGLVDYSVEISTADGERGEGAVATAGYLGAHLSKRSDDPAHRPRPEGAVAADDAEEWLGRQQARGQSKGRAAVAGVQHPGRFIESDRTAAVDLEALVRSRDVAVGVLDDARPQPPETSQHRGPVVSLAQVGYVSGAARQGVKEKGAVRYGLVSVERHGAFEPRGPADGPPHRMVLALPLVLPGVGLLLVRSQLTVPAG